MVNIMVVEDNKDVADSLKDIMKSIGHNVAVTYNGEDFLDKVDEFNPELVLLDVLMPGLKTREILDELNIKGLDFKIILVTAVLFSKEEINELMEEYRIVDYVTKPFTVLDLVDRVNKALGGNENG
ncbi:MAG: response regulator [Archaeoglobaceae archaeon]